MIVQDLADILENLYRTRQTGVLSVSVKHDNHQLKFFIRDGSVYVVTYSSCRNLECLVNLGRLETERCFFLQGTKIDAIQPITLPMPDLISQVRKLRKIVQCSDADASEKNAALGPAGIADDTDLSRMEEELLTMIGPIGGMIFDQALQSCNVTRGAVMPKKIFQRLAQTIALQLPEEYKKSFLAKFGL